MNSISKIQIGSVYTYAERKGTLAFPVKVMSRVEGSKTKVLVRDMTTPVPGKVWTDGSVYEFETHIAHLTSAPVSEIRKLFVNGSREYNEFTD